MKSNSALIRLAMLFAIILAVAMAAFLVNGQTPETQGKSDSRIAVREKARLPNYKGPSRFMGRKALIDGRLVAMSGAKGSITVWDAETDALKATLLGGKAGKEGIRAGIWRESSQSV